MLAGSNEKRVWENKQRTGTRRPQVFESGFELAFAVDVCDVELPPQGGRSRPGLSDIGSGIGIGWIGEDACHGRRRYQLLEQFDLLRNKRVGEKTHPGN